VEIKLHKTDINSLFNLLRERRIISISGESGTGKTTLALQLIASELTKEVTYDNLDNKTVWIQASEQFPKNRLRTFFKSSNGKFDALLKKIFLYPVSSPFLSYEDQSTFLTALGSIILPFSTKYLVIDNISHHLRFAASCCSNIRQKMALLDEFFSSQLFPIIMRCLREEIVLILIHEVSFDPSLGKNQPFFNKLFSRINSVNVCLSKQFQSKSKRMELISRDDKILRDVKYEIKERGISLV
jgi:RecA/RadA recombinase